MDRQIHYAAGRERFVKFVAWFAILAWISLAWISIMIDAIARI